MLKAWVIMKIIATIMLTETSATVMEIMNKENDTIWVAVEPNGSDKLENGGFILEPGTSRTFNVPQSWSGYFWGRTYCNSTTNTCLAGNCDKGLECEPGDGHGAFSYISFLDSDGLKSYTVSGSRGFNIPLSIEPYWDNDFSDHGEYYCKASKCKHHLNDECPKHYRVYHENIVIGCKNPCAALDTDEYCCRGNYSEHDACRAVALPAEYENYFKSRCPDMTLHHLDLAKFKCRAKKFVITFGTLVPLRLD